jgi:opacity protein-like surface antigen
MLVVLGLFLLAASPALAQDTPQGELFVGYTYARTNLRTNTTPEVKDSANLHGVNVAGGWNVNKWFGIYGDYAYHGGTEDNLFEGFLPKTEIRLNSFTFGPRVTYRTERVAPYGQVLFGGVHGSFKEKTSGVKVDDTALAVIVGGGVDVKVNDTISIRVVEASYYLTRFDLRAPGDLDIDGDVIPAGTRLLKETQHNLRLAFGINFTFGRK